MFVSCFEYFVQGSTPQPFKGVRLGTSSEVDLLDLSWNPGPDYPGILATCLSDGSVSLWEVTDNLKIVASLTPTTNATCCKCLDTHAFSSIFHFLSGIFIN